MGKPKILSQIEDIISGKTAVGDSIKLNGNPAEYYINEEQLNTIQTQNILENYLSAHDISPLAKRGKLGVALKGMTAVNLIKNGNFINTSEWGTAGSGAIAVANNIVTATSNGTIINPYIQQATQFPINNKIYARAKVRVTNSVCTESILMTDSQRFATQVSPVQNQWYSLSGVITNTSGIRFRVMHAYVDPATANSKVMEAQNAVAIDLTALFGAGNEPSKEQCDLMFPNYIDVMQGSGNIQVLSTGKNLVYNGNCEYDTNGWSISAGCSLNVENGMFKVSTTGTSKAIYRNISVKPNTNYFLSAISAAGTGTAYLQIFDLNGANIKAGSGIFNSGNNTLIQLAVTMTSVGYIYYGKIQIKEGTTLTDYEPYKFTSNAYKTLDGQIITLHRLLNGVYDEILKDGRNIKRTLEKYLSASDILNMNSSFTNIDAISISRNSLVGLYAQTSQQQIGRMIIQYFQQSDERLISDNVSQIGKWFDNNGQSGSIQIVVAKGTYANLAAAQAALAGIRIIYELAQPQILNTNAVPLIAEPDGHVFITANGCMPSNQLSYPLNLGAVTNGLIEGQKEHSTLLNAVSSPDKTLLSNIFTNKAVSEINAIANDKNVWNSPDNCSLKLKNTNNALAVIVGGVTNDRKAIIQVGHETPFYGNNLGILELNPFGGEVRANGAKVLTDAQTSWINATLQNGWTGTL